ncbi:DNA mismatch repair protein MutT [Polaribacter sp. BM10]|uniref:(deoxy)nucleoside triphosphate pyrophosphohydrolase n=1 Tax=Polaribacter sp. BM10 TaxID=1529069 RepID=UPI00098AC410|nr:(deoxy)nucleoside triphosphate pyrophosphohydrolase [Polaribacter sp. BM10]AQS93628.1 DNA mismatch repair protein MutT [Polaribacter sp. BM10]
MNKTIKVTCAIILFDNEVLAVQRSETMKLPLKWEFPGGKIEEGETEIECLKREIFEELNIKIEIKNQLTPVTHEYPDFKIKLIPFTAEYVSGELILKEHANSVLVNKKKLINLDWAEADLPILKEYLSL